MADIRGFLNFSRYEPVERHPLLRIKDFNEINQSSGDLTCMTQARRCMDCGVPFCVNGCPLGNPVPGFNKLSQQENWYEAQKLLHESNNFPEFTGKVCPAPCESACVLGVISRPVSIKLLEEKIIEKAFEEDWVVPVHPASRSGKRVSVIGSGPAGLACAQQLNRKGHWVRMIEKRPEAGGLLTWGIPEYKLPKHMVRRRISQLEQEDIEIVTNCEVGVDVSFEDLQAESDAVVLCLGAEKPRDLEVPGRGLNGIHFAMDFLAKAHGDPARTWTGPKIDVRGKRVIVIGGGDTGADCIGTSLRLGAAHVQNIEIMPRLPLKRSESNPWPEFARVFKPSTSYTENLAFGGRSDYEVKTVGFVGDEKGVLIGLETIDPGSVDEEVRTSRSRNTDAATFVPCDIVFLALGYLGANDRHIFSGRKADQTENQVDSKHGIKGYKGVFSCGDYRVGQSLVVTAIADGRKTAEHVDEWLRDQPGKFETHSFRSS